MRDIPVSQLVPAEGLPRPLYHRSGTCLYARGEALPQEEIELLRRHRIKTLHAPEGEHDLNEFLRQARHRLLPLDEVDEGTPLSHDVYDAEGTLLVRKGSRVSAEIKERLRARDIEVLYLKKSSRETAQVELRGFEADREVLRAPKARVVRWEATDELDAHELIDGGQIDEERVQRQAESGDLEAVPEGRPLRESLKTRDPLERRAPARMAELAEYDRETGRRTAGIYEELGAGRSVEGRDVGGVTKRIIDSIVADHVLLLHRVTRKEPGRYRVQHAFNTAVYACNIASALGYSKRQVLEVAYGALLQDVGMLQLAPKLIEKPGRYTPAERRQMELHTRHAINYVQRIPALPPSTPLVVYQHHERMDKSGYPRGRPGQLIHKYARISMVADIYDALTSDRPWRKALMPYAAMEALLKLVSQKKLDAEVVRAFLACNSLFPIGSFVRLTDGSIARVAAACREDYTRPVVAVIFRADRRLREPQRVDLRQAGDVRIARAEAGNGLEAGELEGL